MLWPEVWPWVLAAVLERHRTRRWVHRLVWAAYEPPAHDETCECLECSSELHVTTSWTLIR